MRSFLTLLGIILATTTLIAVMSVIHGMDVYIAQQVSDMGADGFRVVRLAMIGESDPKKYMEMLRRNPRLRVEEYDYVRERATLCRDIGLESTLRAPVVRGKERAEGVQIRGATPNLASIANIEVASGRFITGADNQRRQAVAFIGADIRNRFFGGVDPIGKTLQIEGRPFEVIGVAKTQGSVFGQSRDNFIMVPIQTYFKMFGTQRDMNIFAVALDHEHYYQAQDEIRALLRSYRHLRPNQEDTFAIVGSDSLTAAWDRLTGAIAATAVAVVSVFMVVGGVVIMNIMLAVVTERTHEIGIRKSVGARRRDILQQFLIESSMLAGAGGLTGTLVAWALAVLVRNITPVPMSMPLSAVLLAVALSTAVGLFFGIYPARRAAQLDPIEALRMEK
ncbi:MAG: ABC transporter permease [bacterium]|jgi:putative ABC transport system permease protein